MALIEIIGLITIFSILLGLVLNKLLRKKVDFEISLFQSYLSGLIIIYLLVLLGVPLNFMIYGMFYFSIIASLYFFYYFRKKKIKFVSTRFVHILIFSIVAIYLSKDVILAIVYDPILQWDARSIWYFKAKQLFFANGFNEKTGIDGFFSMQSAHSEYPLLVPTLGAFIAKHVGYWNEYVPKANLIFLWIGVLLAFYSLKSMHIISKVIIFISLLIISPVSLTTGYMDVWLGIYSALSILFLMEYVDTYKVDYLISSLCCLIFCNYIKQDATLITLAILCSFVLLIFITKNWRLLKYSIYRMIKFVHLLLLLSIPFFIWVYYKNKWGTTTDFDFWKLTEFSTYNNTFSNVKFDLIYKSMITPIGFAKIILILSLLSIVAIAFSRFSKLVKPVIKNGILRCFFPTLAAVFFAVGMHILYCLSHVDLSWHLGTSAERLRLDLLFISLPSLYGVGRLFFAGLKNSKTT